MPSSSPHSSILGLLCVVLTCLIALNIVTANQDKIATLSPFDFYSNLEGDDLWFDATTNDDIADHWASKTDVHVTRRLQAISGFQYATDIYVSLVGFHNENSARPRLTLTPTDFSTALASSHSSQHAITPLSWQPKLKQTIRYSVNPADTNLSKSISEQLSKQAQTQLDKLLASIKNSPQSAQQVTAQLLQHTLTFRLHPAYIDNLILNHIASAHPRQVEKQHIFYLAALQPSVVFQGQTVPIKYIYTHLPRDTPLLEGLYHKPNPRCDFNQHAVSPSYNHQREFPAPHSSKPSTIFNPNSSTPVVWIDLTAEQLTFHNLPLQDVPTVELTLPSYLIQSYLPVGKQLQHVQESPALLEKAKKQMIIRLISLTKHITSNIFQSEYISKAPLLALSTKINLFHIADHYTKDNFQMIEANKSPNQFRTIIEQIQGIAPRGYTVDVDITPVSLSHCNLCLNAINNALRADPAHAMGGTDGRFIDSSSLFDYFEPFNLNQWAAESVGKTVSYQHWNDGAKGSQFLTKGANLNTSQQYQRVINIWAIEPNVELQMKYQATFLFDKVYQTVANADKTRVLSMMNSLPPVNQCFNNLQPTFATAHGARSALDRKTAMQYVDPANLVTTPQLSLYSTLVSVVYGYGSSKSISFPGGPPVVDSLPLLEGTHPPFLNKVAPAPPSTLIPTVTLTSSTTIHNIHMFNAQQLLADILNTIDVTLSTIHNSKIDFSLLSQDGMNNVVVRMNMLEYKLRQVRTFFSTTLPGKGVGQSSNFKDVPHSTFELIYAYLYSARHDVGWLVLYFSNIAQQQEPTTICAADVVEHAQTIHGLTDLISHYWTSTVAPVINEYTASEEDLKKQRSQKRALSENRRGQTAVDGDINEYIQQSRRTPLVLIGIDIILFLIIIGLCCLCCVLGRKKHVLGVVSGVISDHPSSPRVGDRKNNGFCGCCGTKQKNAGYQPIQGQIGSTPALPNNPSYDF